MFWEGFESELFIAGPSAKPPECPGFFSGWGCLNPEALGRNCSLSICRLGRNEYLNSEECHLFGFISCLVFRELAFSSITMLALPCDLASWYQGLIFAFSVPTPFVVFFWPHWLRQHRPLAEARTTAVRLRQAATPPDTHPSWYPRLLAKAQLTENRHFDLVKHLPSGSQSWVQIG